MRCTSWACAFAFAGSLFIGNAHAQSLKQPLSVRPAAFNYEHYLQDEVASPSDAAAEATESVVADVAPADPEPAAAEAPAAAAPAANTFTASAGCNTCGPTCCEPSCNSCCGGLGLECNLGDPYTISPELFGDCSQWSVGGWFQMGHHNKSNGQFNQHPTNLNLHQAWTYLERTAAPTCGGLDWGFRADFMYGVDADDTQAFGNTGANTTGARGWDTGWNHGIYGWALPQFYGEIASEDWSLKLGHFYTLVGYEVVGAPGNFFYSHAFTMYNSEPFTHTGALLTYSVCDDIETYAGWTAGWDTGFDQFGDGSNYIGGAKLTVTDDVSLTYISTIGNFGARGRNGYMSSIVIDTNLTDKLNYIFQSDVLRVGQTGEDNVGINQYLIYNVNDCLGVEHVLSGGKPMILVL